MASNIDYVQVRKILSLFLKDGNYTTYLTSIYRIE